MTKSNIDLNGLRKEIDERQVARNTEMGMTEKGTAKDFFLNGLLKSRETGRPSHATKVIELLAEKKDPDTLKNEYKKILTETPDNIQSPVRRPNNNTTADRDEQLFESFGKKNRTLAESISEFASPEIKSKIQNNPTNSGNIEQLVNEYLTVNLGAIMENTVNSTLLEMYSAERIKQGLVDSREVLRRMVIDIIQEIQTNQKAKAKAAAELK